MLVEINAVPPIHCCDSTPALSQGLIPLAALKWLMKMAGGLAVFVCDATDHTVLDMTLVSNNGSASL